MRADDRIEYPDPGGLGWLLGQFGLHEEGLTVVGEGFGSGAEGLSGGRAVDDGAARGLGLAVVEWPFLTEIEELTPLGMVAVASRLGPEERRWAVAHAIGHQRLHPGNHLWLRSRTNLASTFEREAEEFAYGFLVDRLEAFRSGAETTQEIATLFGVPEDAVWSHEQMG